MSTLEEKIATDELGNVAGKKVEIKGTDPENATVGGKVDKRKADTELKKVHESFVAIFEGVELPEDFAVKAEGILEAAIAEQVAIKEAAIAEAADLRISEIVENIEERFTQTADKYLDFVADRWIAENKIAVTADAKVSTATSIVEGLQKLLAEHNITISDEEANTIDALKEEIAEARHSYNELAQEMIELNSVKEGLEAQLVLKDIQEGMVLSDAERLASLVEGFDPADIERYRAKVEAVKEANFSGTTAEEDNGLFEEFKGQTPETPMNNSMAALLDEVRKRM